MTLSDELLPCPFCGAELLPDEYSELGVVTVYRHPYNACFLNGQMRGIRFPADTEAWNRRAPPHGEAGVTQVADVGVLPSDNSDYVRLVVEPKHGERAEYRISVGAADVLFHELAGLAGHPALLPTPSVETGRVTPAPYFDGGVGDRLIKAAEASLAEYVYSPDEGSDHEPTEFEREIMFDWFMGLTGDDAFNAVVLEAQSAINALSASPGSSAGVVVKPTTPDAHKALRRVFAGSDAGEHVALIGRLEAIWRHIYKTTGEEGTLQVLAEAMSALASAPPQREGLEEAIEKAATYAARLRRAYDLPATDDPDWTNLVVALKRIRALTGKGGE